MVPSWCPQQPFFEFFPIWPLFFPKNDKNRVFFPPVHALINDPTPKMLQASTGTHDPLFDTNKIWPTLIFLKFVLFGKSPKLPVHALNHDPQKRKLQASTRAHDLLFQLKKIWPTLLFLRFTPPNTFPKLPLHALINDPPKKSYIHQLGPMTHFLTTQKFDPLLYFQGSGLQTHFQSFLCMP